MSEKWRPNLDVLDRLRMPASVNDGVGRPTGPEPPHTRETARRVVAAAIAFAIFIVAGAFAWQAFRPGSGQTAVTAGPVDGTLLWPERTGADLQAAQAKVDGGDTSLGWRLDPEQVATRFAEDVLGWGAPEGAYGVALDTTAISPGEPLVVTLSHIAPPCAPDPSGDGAVAGCPPPFEGERLVLRQGGTTGDAGVWSVAEVRATGLDLSISAGANVDNGAQVAGHVTLPATAGATDGFLGQSGFVVGTDPATCSGGAVMSNLREGVITIDASVGKEGWTAEDCEATSPGFAYVATGNVPPCAQDTSCAVTVLVSPDLASNVRPLYGLTAVPMLMSVLGGPASDTPTPTASPTSSPSEPGARAVGGILVTVEDGSDGSSDVVAVSPDGSEITPIVSGQTDDSDAVWSPDGTMIAFVRQDRNGPCVDSNIYVAAADGSDPRPVTGDPADLQCDVPSVAPGTNLIVAAGVTDDEPQWSPDGSQLAWRTNCSNGQHGIGVMNADGSHAACYTPGDYNGEPHWSPDGSLIAFDSTKDLPQDAFGTDIWLMRPDGSGLRRVTNDGGGNMVSGWSPDGTHLLYSHSEKESDYSWDLWMIAAVGSDATQLTDWPGFDGSGVFSPDGEHVAFASDRFGNEATVRKGEGGGSTPDGLDVYVLSLVDGKVTKVTSYAPLTAWPSGWADSR